MFCGTASNSADNNKSVDMVLVLNGIPVFAFELKNQYTRQNVDHTEVWTTTKLAGKDTYFLPFNQGSNGAGHNYLIQHSAGSGKQIR